MHLFALVAFLTTIAWGGGELIGHGVNRYLNRRNAKRWLAAEAHWKRTTVTHPLDNILIPDQWGWTAETTVAAILRIRNVRFVDIK